MPNKKLELDTTAKIILVIFIIVVTYVISFYILTPVISPQPSDFGPGGMMGMMRAFNPYYNTFATAAALIPALLVGLAAALMIKTKEKAGIKVIKESKDISEYKVLKRAMSDDERKMYDEIKRVRKITQDSLRARLGWSKAKTSRILTNLDRMNLVQRERVGKTYNVFLQKRK